MDGLAIIHCCHRPRYSSYEARSNRSWPNHAGKERSKSVSLDDLREVRIGLAIARRFGLDPIPVARAWITREPHDGYLWQTLVNAATHDEMATLIQLAEALLPFTALPSWPACDLGIGADFKANHCFELILQRLKDFPGLGWSAAAIGLDARVMRTRYMALRVLSEWPRDT
jgi:hypothetical protein